MVIKEAVMGAREICKFAFSALLLVSVAVCVVDVSFSGLVTIKDVNEWEDVGDPDLAKYCIPNWPKANPDIGWRRF